MSFLLVEQAQPRLNRSELAVPGSQPQMFEKAAKSSADVVFLDLEDAVAPDDKAQARKNIIQAIGDIDWGNKALSVRINGLDTPWGVAAGPHTQMAQNIVAAWLAGCATSTPGPAPGTAAQNGQKAAAERQAQQLPVALLDGGRIFCAHVIGSDRHQRPLIPELAGSTQLNPVNPRFPLSHSR